MDCLFFFFCVSSVFFCFIFNIGRGRNKEKCWSGNPCWWVSFMCKWTGGHVRWTHASCFPTKGESVFQKQLLENQEIYFITAEAFLAGRGKGKCQGVKSDASCCLVFENKLNNTRTKVFVVLMSSKHKRLPAVAKSKLWHCHNGIVLNGSYSFFASKILMYSTGHVEWFTRWKSSRHTGINCKSILSGKVRGTWLCIYKRFLWHFDFMQKTQNWLFLKLFLLTFGL